MKPFKPPSFNAWWALVKQAGSAWLDDYAPSMGAALSYYTVFSLAPLLLIAISVAGLVFGQDAAQGAVVDQLRGLIGQNGAQAIQDLLKNVSRPSSGILATVVGVVVLVIGATSVFAELQDIGFKGVLLPTGQGCEDAWITAAALLPSTERLRFLVALRPGSGSPALSVAQPAPCVSAITPSTFGYLSSASGWMSRRK